MDPNTMFINILITITGNFWRIFWVEFIGRLLWGTLILLPVGLLMQVYAYRWLQANKAEEVA